MSSKAVEKSDAIVPTIAHSDSDCSDHSHTSSLDNLLKLTIHSSANMPVDQDGRLYHLGLKRGEVANRIITVGDPRRAFAIAECMDGYDPEAGQSKSRDSDSSTASSNKGKATAFEQFKDNFTNVEAPAEKYGHVSVHFSHRGFVTVTGKYKGTPVSVVAIGMGPSMMDFFVREVRAIVDGPMFVIRFGTCGTACKEHSVGSFAVNQKGAVMVTRNTDYFCPDASGLEPYRFSKPCYPNTPLTNLLLETVKKFAPSIPTVTSMNATCDSFYSSQGRPEGDFIDDNGNLLSDLIKRYPLVSTLDMETFHLFHMASCVRNKPERGIYASALKIIVANRPTNTFLIDEDRKRQLEKIGGTACLETLIQFSP